VSGPVRTGYDPEEEVPLLPVRDYLTQIVAAVRPLATRRVALADALGCVLGSDIVARRDLPPFVSSAMDGYAIRAADIASASSGAPVQLRIVGEVAMGTSPSVAVGPGEAVIVSTGCVVPPGADAVIPVELTHIDGDEVLVLRALAPGKHVRPAGEDVRNGELVMGAGRRLHPPDLGALAGCGVGEVAVIPRARVGVISTGDELVRPPGPLADGQIYDSNAFVLAACVREAGAEPLDGGPVGDEPSGLIAALDLIADDVDAFVCSGGVSMGAHDPVKGAFASDGEHGGDVSFVNVAMQPGRPQAFGHWRGKPFFGLPGNPISVYVSFEVFVRPALAQMMGRPDDRRTIDAVLDGELEAPATRARYARVRVRRDGGRFIATPEGGHQSNLLITFSRADGLVEIPAGTSITTGAACRVLLMREVG
jgi:molybdenum cofactor synthesis domain-containing protein